VLSGEAKRRFGLPILLGSECWMLPISVLRNEIHQATIRDEEIEMFQLPTAFEFELCWSSCNAPQLLRGRGPSRSVNSHSPLMIVGFNPLQLECGYDRGGYPGIIGSL